MQKAIDIEETTENVARVLSIALPEAAVSSPNGLSYISINDYTEPPTLSGELQMAYPMYNKQTESFFWSVVDFQQTAIDRVAERENMLALISQLQMANAGLQETVDALVLEALSQETEVQA